MELFTKEEIDSIIKQVGFNKPSHWSVKGYSDEILGYLGEHLTLIVKTESGVELKFFVKCLPRFEKWKAEYIKETTFFDKECVMLSSLFKSFGEGTRKWRPTAYFLKKDLFVLEDVVELGYTIPRDRNTLTLEEVRACIETMARFHAQSYIYEEKKSKETGRPFRIWEVYSDYLQEPKRGQNWRNAGMRAAIDFLKTYSKFKSYPNFDKKVDTAIRKLFIESESLMKPHSVYRNVVVHRDLWINNIFFKKESNGILHALFVDFQTVLYCSPMLDLSSFLYFNTRRDFRDHYLDEFIDLYYSILSTELKASDIDIANIISRKSLNDCYIDSLKFGLSQAALIVPITLINKEQNERIFKDFGRLERFYEQSRSEEFKEIAENDDQYKSHLLELLDEIVEKYVLLNEP